VNAGQYVGIMKVLEEIRDRMPEREVEAPVPTPAFEPVKQDNVTPWQHSPCEGFRIVSIGQEPIDPCSDCGESGEWRQMFVRVSS
jgi:hypothetical protein